MMKVVDISVKRNRCGLHACLRHAMRLGRWAGYFPVQGLGQLNADNIKFQIKSVYSIYHITTLIAHIVVTGLSFIYFFTHEWTLGTLSNIVFYLTSLLASILLIRLAKHWPKLMKIAEETEQTLIMLNLDNYTIRKCNIIAYTIMVLAFVEHILCLHFSVKSIKECRHETSFNDRMFEHYAMHRMPHVFEVISYNAFKTFLTELHSFQATLVWNLADVLIICISIYLTSYFHNLSKIIDLKKENNILSWGTLRENYSKLAILVKEIGDELSCFILLSFFSDLFFICIQLFNSLHQTNSNIKDCGIEETNNVYSSPDYLLYYLGSFLFLLLRAAILFIFAANVHNAAQEPIISVYDIESSEYDQEVLRFQLQLRFVEVALSGKFFHVTRSMVLKAVSTIITYELVLLQFSKTPSSVVLMEVTNNMTRSTEAY